MIGAGLKESCPDHLIAVIKRPLDFFTSLIVRPLVRVAVCGITNVQSIQEGPGTFPFVEKRIPYMDNVYHHGEIHSPSSHLPDD